MINYHFLLQRYLDASVMSGGALEELGVSPEAVEECGIYQALLKVIDKRNLQAHHGTLDLVLALKELVFIRQRTGNRNPEAVPMDKLSVQQFVHTLAFLASRCELKDVTRSMRANMWPPKALEVQAGQMRRDQVWPGLMYVPGVDMKKVIEMWQEGRAGENSKIYIKILFLKNENQVLLRRSAEVC